MRVNSASARRVVAVLIGVWLGANQAAAAPPRLIKVQNVEQLNAAVADAHPGDRIELAPGRYRTKIRFTAANSGTSAAPVVLTARERPQSAVIDGGGADIVVKFSGAAFVRLEALAITGGGLHGVLFDKGAHHITVDGNRIYDNHGRRPMDNAAELRGSGGDARPSYISITGNEILHNEHPPAGNFQGIDCNYCDNFVISDNFIHDIGSPASEPTSRFDRGSCIQMKSNSRYSVIKRNRIARCHIGIVFGGEGSASPQHFAGVIRNNLIHDSAETAIAVVNVIGGTVIHNTLYGNSESIRVAADTGNPGHRTEVVLVNNILDGPILTLPRFTVTERGNQILSAVQAGQIFQNVEKRNFRLRKTASKLIDKGAAGYTALIDYSNAPRPQGNGFDIGAFEYRP